MRVLGTQVKKSPKPKPKVVVAQTAQTIDKREAPNKVRFQLVREVAGNHAPVVIKSKTIKKTDEIILYKLKPLPRAYFVRSIIRRERKIKGLLWGSKTITDYIVRCNAYFSESLESLEETIPKHSRELANLLLSDDMIQHINGVSAMQKFVLDSTVVKLLLVVFAISIPFGFFMDEILHTVPNQIVIWSP